MKPFTMQFGLCCFRKQVARHPALLLKSPIATMRILYSQAISEFPPNYFQEQGLKNHT